MPTLGTMQVGSHPLGQAARALVVTGLLVALTTAAHALGGGDVSVGAAVVLTLAILPAVAYAVGRRLGGGALLLLLGAGQGLGHVLLAAMAPSVHGVAERMPGHLATHDTLDLALSGAQVLDHAAGVGHAAAGQDAILGHGGSTMLLTHLLTSVVLALLLAKGEDALWAVVTWLLPALDAPVLPGRPRQSPARPPRREPGLLIFASPVARGPPVTL